MEDGWAFLLNRDVGQLMIRIQVRVLLEGRQGVMIELPQRDIKELDRITSHSHIFGSIDGGFSPALTTNENTKDCNPGYYSTVFSVYLEPRG